MSLLHLNDINKTYFGAQPLHVLKGINFLSDSDEAEPSFEISFFCSEFNFSLLITWGISLALSISFGVAFTEPSADSSFIFAFENSISVVDSIV